MRHLRWVLVLLLAGLLVAGCTSRGGSDAGGESERGAGGGVPGAADGGDEAADGAAGGEDDATDDRQVITHAWTTVVVDDPAEAVDEIVRRTEEAGGRVDERSEYAGGDGPGAGPQRASLVLRVPADRLSTLVEDLDDLGDVREFSQTGEDVTRTTRDLDARITALQTSVDRLLQIMADAENAEALVAAEESLSRRQAELESLQSERAYLADQVAMSTLRVELVARAEARVETGGFVGGLEQGWRSLLAALSGLLVVLGVLVPWLIVLVPLAALGLWLRRRRRTARPRPAGGPGGPGAGGPGRDDGPGPAAPPAADTDPARRPSSPDAAPKDETAPPQPATSR